METRNGNYRSSGKPSTPKAEKDYCNEATPSGPLTDSQTHQAQYVVKHTEVKQRWALDKRANKRSDMVLYVLQTAF